MPDDTDVSRRIFLERLAAGALVAAGAGNKPAQAASNDAAWTPPPVLKNPNILVIMVDQLRPPMWMSAGQLAALPQTILPNILGRIAPNSYSFEQFFVAATICTASRAALLTGLYAPQTAMYLTGTDIPSLNPAFPTFGDAVAALNPAYQGNVWWFGKWHLTDQASDQGNTAPLLPYGFNTRTYPGGAAANPDPVGDANEGTDGGLFDGQVYASDAMIAGDFVGWLEGQAPTNGAPRRPGARLLASSTRTIWPMLPPGCRATLFRLPTFPCNRYISLRLKASRPRFTQRSLRHGIGRICRMSPISPACRISFWRIIWTRSTER
jgi:hypothetical protein